MDEVREVDLTAPEASSEGKVVCRMWYGELLDCLLTRDEYSGCPNDGMRHRLVLRLNRGDLEAFFKILEEYFYGRFYEGLQALKQRA
ncbi:MAG: hypothetical protein MUC28_03010, partial [Planctomycetes bacterium]|nr:hypothetical protein [Planctomycetota bacterium]